MAAPLRQMNQRVVPAVTPLEGERARRTLRLMPDDPLSDTELDELEGLTIAASPAPWIAKTGPAIGGPDFIMLTDYDDSLPDMYVRHDDKPAPGADLEFIAAARNSIPRLIAEVRRLRER
jgi:hypothetical protein